MKYVIGLDLSMRCTGYCVLDLNGNIVESGIINPKYNMENQKKLREKANRFFELACEYDLVFVGIEKGFTNHNKATQIIFRVHGVANMAFSDIHQEYFHNSTVKKEFTGNGKASKEMMIERVKEKYGLDITNDEADAIAVAELALKEYEKVNK